jgi:methylphosphotriester-DNA--protein-cysteine methyltransferase
VGIPLLILAGVASQLLRDGESELFRWASPPPPDPAEERVAQAPRRLMLDERAYRSDDLGVASLAVRLSVPEYRLRRPVNRRAGHRNPNAYANAFRLQEVPRARAGPAWRELPGPSLALVTGFRSSGPFNSAANAATGLRPSKFRRARLGDS